MKRIRFDLNGEWIKKSENWRFGLGCDHAFQLHRKDLFEQLKYVHDELGFQYLRFHGIFDDDMLTYQRMSDYKPLSAIPHTKDIYEINFQQVGDVYHNVLDAGFKPFVEISFMPSALAKGKKTGLKYKNNICMPKSLSKWEHFVKEFIHYLIGEFGKEEVESWYFEIWNEPDLGIFFNGKQKDYFKLYVSTVKAIKEVDGNLRVGGPSTSACKWLKDFVDYCKANNVPCDFVSTHHYTGDAFGNMLTVKNALKMFPITKRNAKNGVGIGETLCEYFFYPEICKTWKKGTFNAMDKNALEEVSGLPLFITEWNSMAVFGAPVHDEKYSSAFAIKTALDLNPAIAGSSFWCVSDIFEENHYLQKPFCGSYGIVTQNNIAKPNFWAFKIMSMLYENRLKLEITNEDIEYAVFKDDEGNYQIVIYNQDFVYGKDQSYDFEIELPFEPAEIVEYRIDDDHANPKKMWVEMGSPSTINRTQIEDIKEKTALRGQKVEANGNRIVSTIHTNDIVMYEIKRGE